MREICKSADEDPWVKTSFTVSQSIYATCNFSAQQTLSIYLLNDSKPVLYYDDSSEGTYTYYFITQVAEEKNPNKRAYAEWVSEIMLQQVAKALPTHKNCFQC